MSQRKKDPFIDLLAAIERVCIVGPFSEKVKTEADCGSKLNELYTLYHLPRKNDGDIKTQPTVLWGGLYSWHFCFILEHFSRYFV